MNTFDEFMQAVRDSVEGHAKRKNYTDSGADGENKLLTVMNALGIHEAHSIGEIIYKCAEYLREPRRVLLEKIAGWAFVIWREYNHGANSVNEKGNLVGTQTIPEGLLDLARQAQTVGGSLAGGSTYIGGDYYEKTQVNRSRPPKPTPY